MAKTPMRNTALALSSIVVVFFACFLAYTVFARQHLDRLARQFVTEKTVQHSEPLVNLADESIKAPLVQRLLSGDQIAASRGEITNYRRNPSSYISDLTRQNPRNAPKKNASPLLEEIASIKEQVRTFYDDTLTALINDLRIFSGSNMVAGLIALGLAFRSGPKVRQSIVWFSVLMFAAVLYCSYLYVDDLTFFRILFRTHMGWWYPVLLCLMIAAMYMDYGGGQKTSAQNERQRGRDAAELVHTSEPSAPHLAEHDRFKGGDDAAEQHP